MESKVERPAGVIPCSFFERPVLEICPELLGQFLVTEIDGRVGRFEVTETEAYDGPHDLACHASKGKTPRTEVLFGDPGQWYVYLCYGVHWLLNVLTGPVDFQRYPDSWSGRLDRTGYSDSGVED